jgi:hypothetical protein
MEVDPMAKYVPSPKDWVREQVEFYEGLRDTGLPVIIVTHIGNKTGAIRKTPLMRVKDGNSYVLVGSQGRGTNGSGLGAQSARQSGC